MCLIAWDSRGLVEQWTPPVIATELVALLEKGGPAISAGSHGIECETRLVARIDENRLFVPSNELTDVRELTAVPRLAPVLAALALFHAHDHAPGRRCQSVAR